MKTALYIFLVFILGSFLALAIGLMSIINYTKDLPDYKQLREYSPSIISRLYTGNGSLLAEFSKQKRIFVPIASMPDKVINAFVSAEDKNFFKHSGLDFFSISKAVVINLKNLVKGKRLVGASTITQQVAKNFLLSNEISLNRKMKEALLSLRIERILSKNRILELYLNEIFLGNRSYGVAAAALNYFNKSLDELELHEIAYLAGLPKGPNNYHPVKNKKAAIIRRNYVLNRMEEDGLILKEDATKASLQPIIQKKLNYKEKIYAPYFIEEVRRKIIEMYDEKALYSEGLNIITTIDPEMQETAISSLRIGLESYDKRLGWRGPLENIGPKKKEEKLKKIIKKYSKTVRVHNKLLAQVIEVNDKRVRLRLLKYEKEIELNSKNLENSTWIFNNKKNMQSKKINSLFNKNDIIVVSKNEKGSKFEYKIDQIPKINGAIVAIDPRNGRVLSMSGGYNFDGSEFNRATQARRQPGSAFKPFVYLAALENGYLPNSRVLDAPLVIDQGPNLGKWKPKNYSGNFYGPSTLRIGLEKSRNVMTVRLANEVGMKKITDLAKRFKLGNFPPLLATSLGAEEVTLIDLVAAYASFVNGGRYNEPAIIEKIQNRNGKVIFRRDQRVCKKCLIEIKNNNFIKPLLPPEGNKVIDQNHAFQLTWMLKGVTKRGTAKSLKDIKFSVAGKTGTTNDNMDAWFLGFSSELVVGVFVGYDTPKSLGENETGGRVAVPIFKDFIKKVYQNKKSRPFLVPENIEMIKIDYNTGKKIVNKKKNTIYEAFSKGSFRSDPIRRQEDEEVINDFEDNLY